MRNFRLLVIVMAVALSCGAAQAAPDLAYGAYQRGLYNQALREATLRLEKDKTDLAAMTLLGELYNQGLGVPASPAKAVEWYRLAAARGDARALSSLGMMALEGRGMERNSRKAARGSKRPPRRETRLRATIWRSSCSPALPRRM